jgi:hypothetical protein
MKEGLLMVNITTTSKLNGSCLSPINVKSISYYQTKVWIPILQNVQTMIYVKLENIE